MSGYLLNGRRLCSFLTVLSTYCSVLMPSCCSKLNPQYVDGNHGHRKSTNLILFRIASIVNISQPDRECLAPVKSPSAGSCRQTPRTGNHTPLAVHPRPQLPGVFHPSTSCLHLPHNRPHPPFYSPYSIHVVAQ